MPYGLTDIELKKINGVFSDNGRIEKVILYGSRAKGNFKPFSDVDITLVGKDLSRQDLLQVMRKVDDLSLPYRFDVSLFHTLRHEALLEHIGRVGVELYRKQA